MTTIGKDLPVRSDAFRFNSEKRASSAATSPARTECFDIFSPEPGESDVISQMERLSSKEIKIAARLVWMAVGASCRSATVGMIVSRVGVRNLTLPERWSLSASPWDLSTPKSVQKLQTALHAKAKAEPGYRFYALYDKISREDILAHAYALCRSNKGAPGVDRQDFADIEAYGVERWLGELALALRQETYRPDPIRRVYIPKANGKLRPLGISTLRDRVCMTAAMLVLEPIFEADLPPELYAYRPGRNAQQAVAKVQELLFRGHPDVVDADLADYLDVASYCPQVHEVRSKSSVCRAIALMRSPFCFPRITWTASSSPRLTRCNTVWRETPSAFIASRIGMKPSLASLLNRAMTSSVNRMRHGAPGVSCSPGMIPALSKRWRVEGATPSTTAAFLMVSNSPSACTALGSKQGISQCRRRLATRPASK